MSSTWGRNFRVSIFGESHGSHVGVGIDGVLPGTQIDMDYIMKHMQRRAPGRDSLSTARKESDQPQIISGVFEGRATGAPIYMLIENEDKISRDYSKIKGMARPGHADYSAFVKYGGYNDYRGGGYFSGRLTAGLVFAGSIARYILEKRGIYIASHISRLKEIEDIPFDEVHMTKEKFEDLSSMRLPFIAKDLEEEARQLIIKTKEKGDSIGGVVELGLIGLGAGIGDPFFEGLESVLSSIIFSVPAVKGVEFGSGFAISDMYGSQANDEFYYDDDGRVKTRTNNNGGINGGISNGMPIVLRVAIKPTPSISIPQNTIDMNNKREVPIRVGGRHDPVIVARVIPVLEAALAIGILDSLMEADKNRV